MDIGKAKVGNSDLSILCLGADGSLLAAHLRENRGGDKKNESGMHDLYSRMQG
jgi:hypothetical protein